VFKAEQFHTTPKEFTGFVTADHIAAQPHWQAASSTGQHLMLHREGSSSILHLANLERFAL